MIIVRFFNVIIILGFYKIINICIKLFLLYFIVILYFWIVGKWLVCQFMDNKIIIFNVLNRFKYMRKKIFIGYMVCILLFVKYDIVRSDQIY